MQLQRSAKNQLRFGKVIATNQRHIFWDRVYDLLIVTDFDLTYIWQTGTVSEI